MRDAPYAFSSTYDSASHRSAESWREQADSTSQGSDRATFLAFSEDMPVGIAALYRLEDQDDVGEVVQVWVVPEYRGTEVAWDLMNAIFLWAGENHFRTIKAGVTLRNTRALKFYTKVGFSIAVGDSRPDVEGVYMVKEIKEH